MHRVNVPAGSIPRGLVYVDFDGTMTRTNSLQYVQALRGLLARRQPCLAHHAAYLATIAWIPFLLALHGLGAAAARDRGTYRLYRRIRAETLSDLCQAYWREHYALAHRAAALERLRHYASQGYEIVILSGSIVPIIRAFVQQAGLTDDITTIIGARLESDSAGVLTGRLLGPPTVAARKVVEAIAWEATRSATCRERICISDSSSDLPMLEYGQKAIVVAPDRRLRRLATSRGWEVLESSAETAPQPQR